MDPESDSGDMVQKYLALLCKERAKNDDDEDQYKFYSENSKLNTKKSLLEESSAVIRSKDDCAETNQPQKQFLKKKSSIISDLISTNLIKK